MGFLKNIIRNAVDEGISNGIREAVSSATEKIVAPKAEAYANKVARSLDQATDEMTTAGEAASAGEKKSGFSALEESLDRLSKSAEQYAAAGRQELADNELAEEKVLAEYLPKMLSEEEVEAKLREIIAQVGASAPSDMGKVMGVATKALAGLADGKTISTIVRKLLA